MPIFREEVHPVQAAFTAGGTINLELSPKPYTITRMVVIARASITTTTATNLNDYWDRIINNLSLSGAGKTFFNFTNLRTAYHFTRFAGFGMPRPTVVADSATTLVQHVAWCFHFGVQPLKINAAGMIEDNPWDLSAGIPPTGSGNLTLQGAFGAAAAPGTNVTVNDADLDVYLYGVQKGKGESDAAIMPKALPAWQMFTPTPAATSSALATQWNVPAGDYLHSALVMVTNGAGAPRDDSVLNSFEVFNAQDNRSILRYGGQSGVVGDYKAAEILSQFKSRFYRMPYSDNVSTAMTAIASGGTPGVPAISSGVDSGLIWLPLYQFGGDPIYGVNLSQVNTGDLQFRYGVSDATGVTLDVFLRKYQKL